MAVLTVRHFAEHAAPFWALTFFVFIVSQMASQLPSSLAWVLNITRRIVTYSEAHEFKAARPERQSRVISSSVSFPPQFRSTLLPFRPGP